MGAAALAGAGAPLGAGIPRHRIGRARADLFDQQFSAVELLDRHPVDVIVDFSSDDGLVLLRREARKRGITIISAVSRYSEASEAHIASLARDIRVLHSPNITLGVNFLIVAAKILKQIAPYTDIEIIEEHFKQKSEISGTAKIIASNLELPESSIKTIRAGGIIGVHEILFGFPLPDRSPQARVDLPQSLRQRHPVRARQPARYAGRP